MLKSLFVFALGTLFTAPLAAQLPTDAQERARRRAECAECDLLKLREIFSSSTVQLRRRGKIVRQAPAGFRRLDDPVLPPAVRAARASVLQIAYLARSGTEMSSVSTEKLRKVLYKLLLARESIDLTRILLAHLQRCERTHAAICEYPSANTLVSVATGTGFLVGDSGREVWTAMHVIDDLLNIQLSEQETSVAHWRADPLQRLQVYVFDADGNALLLPGENGASLARSGVGDNPRRDFAVLQFDQSLARPGLTLAPRLPRTGEPVYALGYAKATGRAEFYRDVKDVLSEGTRFPFDDAPGGELRATLGTVLSTSPLTLSIDGARGMSGGPTLDGYGRVVGVNARASYSGYQLPLENGAIEQAFFRMFVLAPVKWPSVPLPRRRDSSARSRLQN